MEGEKLQILKTYFGYDSFRPGQEEIIDQILAGRDALAIMPTGAGKSLCYQVPALMMRGITIVISPLISLMMDQVKALNEAGIHAAYINSSLTENQVAKALEFAKAGRYKIVYVAPERLETPRFLDFACHAEISMVTIDEAHCISQWGQDFRPSYVRIVSFIRQLPVRPIVTAFTATATKRVQTDIREVLKLQNPYVAVTGFDRENLYFEVQRTKEKKERIRVFEEAKKNAPCIIFIDEIDAVARRRGTGMGGGHDEREQTLNQMLVEMDGFGVNEGIIVMAATNRVDILDPAILRPGRFDRKVGVGKPDIRGREEILKVHSKEKPLGDDVDLTRVAQTTAGFTGADLENLLNEAAILATRSKRRFIMQEDIDEAILKVVMGPEKKSRIVSERARRLTAYHESGHAIASFFLKNSDPVHYITIIPRGAAGGFTWYRKAEDAEDFTSRGEMFDSIVSALGGRIAEQLFLDDISTGASGDIQQATNVARDMVMKYGMSEKLGPISFDDSSHSIFIGRDFGTTKSYSEETAATIDEEVKHIFDQAYAKCEALLREHADLLTGLAEYLLIHETIEGDDFRYYCEHGQMPIHPDDTIEPPAKVIRRMDEAPVAPQPEAETQPTDGDTPDGGEKTE